MSRHQVVSLAAVLLAVITAGAWWIQSDGAGGSIALQADAHAIEAPELLADLRDEVIDRFGALPREAETLFDLVGLKYPLRKLGIIKLEQGPANLVFSFGDHSPLAPETLLAFIAQSRPRKSPGKKEPRPKRGLRVPAKNPAPAPEPVRLTPDQRLIIALDEHIEQEELFRRINAVLGFLGAQAG